MVKVIISSDPRYHIDKSLIQDSVLHVLKKHRVYGKVEIEVNIIGNRLMHELNKKFRGIDDTTDVLSFALEDPTSQKRNLLGGFVSAPDRVLRLGSICISYPKALEDASLEGISVEEEINFLVEHGTNHLLGIHHD